MAAYATSADLIARFDVRLVGDLASTDGTQMTATAMADDVRIAAALDDASGEIDSAIMVAARYTAAQLAALTGTGLAHLKRICCDIAFFLLIDRRCLVGITGDEAERREKKASEHLENMRNGRAIFNIEVVKEAALPSQAQPTTVELTNQNTMVSRVRGHMYPRYQLPNGR